MELTLGGYRAARVLPLAIQRDTFAAITKLLFRVRDLRAQPHHSESCNDYRPPNHRICGNCRTSHHNTRSRHGARHTECDGTRTTCRSFNHPWNLLWAFCPRDTFGSRTVTDSAEIGDGIRSRQITWCSVFDLARRPIALAGTPWLKPSV